MKTLSKEDLEILDGYFRAANYLSVGQLYLLDNPLLNKKLELKDIKKTLVGHFGTTPGQNFIYTHLNRIIKKDNLNMIYISGPGHGGNSMTSNTYLEGSFTKKYTDVTCDIKGMKRLFKMFSFPGGISSHASPEVPGSIHEGGELGYSLSHAYGTVLDNPSLITACVVGDGEAETGPLAASWMLNKIINPKTDGVVLPILHLNGYKIANPTLFGRMTNEELYHFFVGCGYRPYLVAGADVNYMHERMAKVLDMVMKDIKKIKNSKDETCIKWPMIILKTPKGWLGPKVVNNKQVEGTFRSHQIPLVVDKEHEENISILEAWLKSYRPDELFDSNGSLIEKYKKFIPDISSCMGSNLNANGGALLKELITPDFRNYEVKFKVPGEIEKSDMLELGNYIRDVISLNKNNFLIFGPDEALSNRLNNIFSVTKRKWNGITLDKDEDLSPRGRIIDSILSEHLCEGLLEGYILTGRYGFMHSYEAFIRVVDSMACQHAKWLKVAKEIPWRSDIASLNYVLTSHIWQQDHNGFTHQNPGFLDNLVTKKADIIRMYLPFDANTLICTFDHCIKTKNYINVIVASKHLRPQWLTMNEAINHCKSGIGILDFASNCKSDPDVVLACAGDTPTLEVIAASKILQEKVKKIKVRVVNVIDLMKLQSSDEHPHGLTNKDYDSIFTKTKPIVFAFHGYPNLIHQLTYKRNNDNLHVSGYIEEGTITTPFDMRVQNKIDRFNLVIKALKYVDGFDEEKKEVVLWCKNKLKEHQKYIKEFGVDMDEIKNFKF